MKHPETDKRSPVLDAGGKLEDLGIPMKASLDWKPNAVLHIRAMTENQTRDLLSLLKCLFYHITK